MSNLKIQGNASGTGTTTLQSGNTNSNLTLALPIADGTTNQALVTDGAGVLSFASTGSGDVVGPASSTDNAVTRYDSTTGKLLQNSLVTVADDGAITAPSVGSVIPFYYANQAAFPSAATYHGAIVHSHADAAMYFAHSSAWVEMLKSGGALGTPSSGTLSGCTVDGTDAVGFRNVPINSQSAAYTTVLADSGKAILHPSTDANARTFTIPANASVAYAVGTVLTFINMTSQVVTIAITSDTLYLAGTGTTGSRSLAQYGMASAIKMTATTWIVSGNGVT